MNAKTKKPAPKKTAPSQTATSDSTPSKAQKKDKANKPTTKPSKAAAPEKRRTSAIDAAVRVLGETKTAMNTRELIETMATKGYWSSPGGQTPHATLYSAIIREIAHRGKEARFKKTERGRFTLAG